MSVPYLIAAAGLALFFVCAEGSMIWYLLTSMRKKADSQTTVLCVVGKEKVCSLWRCIQYSFIWIFLFGHHTIRNRWAAGAALLYEQRWNKGSDSTIVLMTVAVIYKICDWYVLGLAAKCLLFLRRRIENRAAVLFSIIFAGACAEHGCRCSCTCRNAFSTVDDCRLGVGGKAVYPARHLESKSTAHG